MPSSSYTKKKITRWQPTATKALEGLPILEMSLINMIFTNEEMVDRQGGAGHTLDLTWNPTFEPKLCKHSLGTESSIINTRNNQATNRLLKLTWTWGLSGKHSLGSTVNNTKAFRINIRSPTTVGLSSKKKPPRWLNCFNVRYKKSLNIIMAILWKCKRPEKLQFPVIITSTNHWTLKKPKNVIEGFYFVQSASHHKCYKNM